MTQLPQPFPERHELEEIRWDFPFGQSYSQDSLKGALRFVYTECEIFTQAIEPRYRIIMGRKGSGKTSLIKRIRLGNEYDIKVICKKEELFTWVETSIKQNSIEEELIEPYENRCMDFFWISIFQEIVQKAELNHVKYFLKKIQRDQGTILAGIQEWSSVNLNAKNLFASVSAAIISIFIKDKKVDFDKAKLEAISFLKGKKVVVLIDNLEDYPFNTLRTQKIFAALLLSTVNFSDEANITVKCFIPSKFSIKLKDNIVNWGKLNQHMIELRWKDKELLTMLCRRLRFYLYRQSQYNESDFSDFQEVSQSLSFWNSYFVPKVYNKAFDIEETVIPYILRHTQLTPRQAIQLCNSIVSKEPNFPAQTISEEKIRKGIEEKESDLCEEIFNSCKQTYPNVEKLCSQYLRKLPMSFPLSTLRHEVYEQLDNNNDNYKIYRNDYILFERMLFGLGIIGIGVNSNQISQTIYSTYNIAQFKPSCENNLSPNEGDQIFVHPMFIHKINFVRNRNACSKPVCPIKVVETPEIFEY